MIKNFELHDTLGGDDNVLLFDIYIQHTNAGASGAFELALNQYFFNFNSAIPNGGTLTYKIVPGSSQLSNSAAIPRNPRIMNGDRLDLASNAALGSGNGPIISTSYPGTRIVRMRLATDAASFAYEYLDLVIRRGPSNPFTKIFAYINDQSTDISSNGTYSIDSITAVPVKFILAPEGFLNSTSNKLNSKDTIRIYTRKNTSPYQIIDSTKSVIDTATLTCTVVFNNTPSGIYYFIIKHRNSIETWSKSGGESYSAGWNFSYDFTSASSQAYGSNMILKGTKYCIYSGDVNQDGVIDATDTGVIDNDALNFITGYAASDLTGDGITDATDYSIADNNAANFVSALSP